jgi:hypothetical protein
MSRSRPTELQKWQRERFQLKGAVSGMKTRVKQLYKLPYTTAAERYWLDRIGERLQCILTRWDVNQAETRMDAERRCQSIRWRGSRRDGYS